MIQNDFWHSWRIFDVHMFFTSYFPMIHNDFKRHPSINGLVQGKISRKTPYLNCLVVKLMVSKIFLVFHGKIDGFFRFSLTNPLSPSDETHIPSSPARPSWSVAATRWGPSWAPATSGRGVAACAPRPGIDSWGRNGARSQVLGWHLVSQEIADFNQNGPWGFRVANWFLWLAPVGG